MAWCFSTRASLAIVLSMNSYVFSCLWSHKMRLRKNGGSVADIFKYMFLKANCCILIQISQKFVPVDPICNKSALVQVMAWHGEGDKPLPELLLTNICVIIGVNRPQWVNLKGELCFALRYHVVADVSLSVNCPFVRTEIINFDISNGKSIIKTVISW